MRKKEIEGIPYLGLKRVKRGKLVEHVTMTDIKEVGQKPCLFVEVYRNRKGAGEVPVVRIVVAKDDFGSYFPETGTWSRGRIKSESWSGYNLIWREDRLLEKEMDEREVLQSPEDLERIAGFLGDEKDWGSSRSWWWRIDRRQEAIACKERLRKWERRKRALEERGANTEELPEQRILQYAEDSLFLREHRLYYKKHGARATVACSGCGGVSDRRWKPGQSYESQFEARMEEPRMGAYGRCPMCGRLGKFVPQGKARTAERGTRHLFLGQRYRADGLVVRYIAVEKTWRLELECTDSGDEMTGAGEELMAVEIARTYLEPGKKAQTDFQKHSWASGENFWDDCNLSGMNNINIRPAPIMRETYENMKGTFLRYSAIEEYQKAAGEDINPADYLERYMETPQMEVLVKMGLTKLVDELVRCHYGIVEDVDAKRLDEFLGIRKERVGQLVRHKGDKHILEVMKKEKRLGQNWTEAQVEQLAELGTVGIGDILDYMGTQKFLNRVSKYAGCGYGTMCSRASARLKETAMLYQDYLGMRKKLGYDMTNSAYLFPRKLEAAHAKMVAECNKEECDRRMQEVNSRFRMIRKNYSKLRKRFFFQDDEYMIRPARDAGEIVMEGRILHHCVGGDNYLEKHDAGRSVILFLRHRQEPEVPYITVEVMAETLEIRQWYGEHDKKPDRDRMQKWMDVYATWLKCGNAAAGGMEAGMMAAGA